LNLGLADLDHGRTTVDHDADPTAMRFAEGRNTKELSEGIAHAGKILDATVRSSHRFHKVVVVPSTETNKQAVGTTASPTIFGAVF
jgi:hypothetical protein